MNINDGLLRRSDRYLLVCSEVSPELKLQTLHDHLYTLYCQNWKGLLQISEETSESWQIPRRHAREETLPNVLIQSSLYGINSFFHKKSAGDGMTKPSSR